MRVQSVENMWKFTNEIMVLIERATPEGHRCIQLVRDHIINTSSQNNPLYVLAPVFGLDLLLVSA